MMRVWGAMAVAGRLKMLAWVACLGFVSAALSACGSSGPKKLTAEELIKLATPAVIRIQGSEGGGSGVVIDAARQLAVTNYHVVAGNAALKAQVGNETGTSNPVQVIAASPCDDLAVVRLVNRQPNLKALKIASSKPVTPGDEVTVLGFPASAQSGGGASNGISQSTTVVADRGSVSQVNVQVNTNASNSNYDPSSPPYQSMIVHSAPVNHGNSGGPLLNAQGEVIGINTLTGPETQGQYYAIASDYMQRILPDLEAGHSHANIGWSLVRLPGLSDEETKSLLDGIYGESEFPEEDKSKLSEATKELIEAAKLTVMYDKGDQQGSAAANSYPPGKPSEPSPTEGFGIIKINKTPVTSVQDVCNVVSSVSPGETMKLEAINVATGNDPSKVSAVQVTNHEDPRWTMELKVPSQ